MSAPLLAIGLGNPGAEYEDTRHNVGHRVIDTLAESLGVSFDRHPEALVGWTNHEDRDLGLALPLTYMNRSGNAVASLKHEYDLELNDLLVVVDDIHLSVGDIRLRPGGSSGGHNGLAHVAQRLGTDDYPRLRIGIGNDFAAGEQVDYVLSPFTSDQEPTLRDSIERAGDAILTLLETDLDTTMNQYN